MKKPGLALALFAITALPASAADSPFAGTWKLNVPKSHFTGDTFTYTRNPSGVMHYSDGGVEYDFGTDGKPYPTLGDHTTTWTRADEHTWDSISKAGTTVIRKAHRVLSADGNTLIVTFIDLRPDGGTDESSNTYTRVSGGPGLAGTWKDVRAKVPSETISISVPSPGQIVYEDPGYKLKVAGPTDGTPITVTGPTVPEGFVIMYKAAAPNKLEYTIKFKDKATNQGVMTVNGKTLTDVEWIPGKEDEKSTSIYDRQ